MRQRAKEKRRRTGLNVLAHAKIYKNDWNKHSRLVYHSLRFAWYTSKCRLKVSSCLLSRSRSEELKIYEMLKHKIWNVPEKRACVPERYKFQSTERQIEQHETHRPKWGEYISTNQNCSVHVPKWMERDGETGRKCPDNIVRARDERECKIVIYLLLVDVSAAKEEVKRLRTCLEKTNNNGKTRLYHTIHNRIYTRLCDGLNGALSRSLIRPRRTYRLASLWLPHCQVWCVDIRRVELQFRSNFMISHHRRAMMMMMAQAKSNWNKIKFNEANRLRISAFLRFLTNTVRASLSVVINSRSLVVPVNHTLTPRYRLNGSGEKGKSRQARENVNSFTLSSPSSVIETHQFTRCGDNERRLHPRIWWHVLYATVSAEMMMKTQKRRTEWNEMQT